MIRGSLADAGRNFMTALERARRLVELKPEEPRWQRNLALCLERTGNLKRARGDLDGAQADYQRPQLIRERLAASDPGNAGWQRDLAVSYYMLGALAEEQGREADLKRHWRAMLAIFDALDRQGLHISPADRAWLEGIRARVDE